MASTRTPPARRMLTSAPALRVIALRRSNSIASGAKWTLSEFAVLDTRPGRLSTAPHVLSIRYLASRHDIAMKYLRFFLKNS